MIKDKGKKRWRLPRLTQLYFICEQCGRGVKWPENRARKYCSPRCRKQREKDRKEGNPLRGDEGYVSEEMLHSLGVEIEVSEDVVEAMRLVEEGWED